MGQRTEAVLPVTARYFDFVPHHAGADEGIGPYKARRKIVGADRVVHPYKAHREKAHFLFCF